jgi:hypothetical protein
LIAQCMLACVLLCGFVYHLQLSLVRLKWSSTVVAELLRICSSHVWFVHKKASYVDDDMRTLGTLRERSSSHGMPQREFDGYLPTYLPGHRVHDMILVSARDTFLFSQNIISLLRKRELERRKVSGNTYGVSISEMF